MIPTRYLIVLSSALPSVGVAVVVLKSVDWRGYLSTLVGELATQPMCDSDVARDAFTQTPVDSAPRVPGHTHPHAAAYRSGATTFAQNICVYSGCQLFVLAMSRSDQRKDYRGCRQWYWAKDTNIENRMDKAEANDLEYICDVDYYIDMPRLLSARPKPTLLYTCVPEQASSTGVDETSTYFDTSGALVTLVAGGGTYQHHLWDYGSDSLVVSRRFLGVTYKLITYAVERKQVAVNRQLILLAPIKEFKWYVAWLASFIIKGKHLKRFDPIQRSPEGESFVRFLVHKKEGSFVTVGRPNQLLSATIPAETFHALGEVAKLGVTNMMLTTVQSWIPKEERPSTTILTAYFRACNPNKMPVVYPVSLGVRAYQYEPQNFDQNARPKLQAYMPPLVHGAFAPVPNAAGERQCVQGRIVNLRKDEPKPHAFRDRCLHEFVELVVDGEVLEPVCYDTVAEKQTNPQQKLSLRKATVHGPIFKNVIKCFIKSEAYSDVKDPRNISQFDDLVKLEMAQFSLALAKHCKKFAWYGPGKTPVEIAERVAEICRESKEFLNVSDYHRMDGTISYWLRSVERGVFMKAFEHHKAPLNELLKKHADNKGFLPEGTTFDQGPSHGSGGSDTSLSQTLRAAFTAYLGYRHSTVNGKRFTPSQAFSKIGIHLGDDGCDPDLSPADHKWAADRVGLVLEADVVYRGEPGVNFLARYYSPDVWYGRTDSMCDVRRQLSKFHTTVRLPFGVTPEHKLVEKAMAYVATDGYTPVIGPFCKQVLLLSTYRPKVPIGLGNWWTKFDDSVQFPNCNADGWMDMEFERQFPEFDRLLFANWLDSCQTIPQILEPPLCAEPRPATPTTVDVVVDGDVLPALETVQESESPDIIRKEPQEETSKEEESPVSQHRGKRSRRPNGRSRMNVTHKPRKQRNGSPNKK